LLEEAEVHCFKRGIETKEFIKKVEDVCKLSSKIKVPVEELPTHIEKKKKELFSLDMDIIMKKVERRNVPHNLNLAFEKYAAKLAEVMRLLNFEPN
jgi:hypothetical protein